VEIGRDGGHFQGSQRDGSWNKSACSKTSMLIFSNHLKRKSLGTFTKQPSKWENNTGNSLDWIRESSNRNSITKIINEDVQKDNFVIINTDADEIPNPDRLEEFRPGMELHSNFTKKQPMMLAMDFFNYNLNWRYPGTSNSGHVLPGQYVLSGNFHLSQLRKTPNLFDGDNLGCSHKLCLLQDAGWHFSYAFTVDQIIHKTESFAHQEFNNQKIKSPEHIRNCMVNGKDLYGRKGTEHAMVHYGYRQVPLPLLKFHE